MNGIGAMLHALGGGSDEDRNKYVGRVIKSAVFQSDTFVISFEDGVTINITDDGQSCCEYRYMTCDDDPTSLNGKTLKGIEVKSVESPDTEDYGTHEIAFLEVSTTDGTIVQFATHNEHNGYYGGFGLNIAEGK